MNAKKERLFHYLKAADPMDEDVSDAYWFTYLQDTVREWCDKEGVNYDPTDTVHEYLRWDEKR